MATQAYWQGDWYEATDTTAAGESPTQFPDKWRKIEIPQKFRRFITERAAATVLEVVGQNDKATISAGRAIDSLMQTAVGEAQTDNCNADTRANVQSR